MPLLGWGALTTFALFGLSLLFAMTVATAIATARAEEKRPGLLKLYVDFFRSVPLVLVLLFYFLALPSFFGKIPTAVFAYTVFESAYFSEILRAAIVSIPEGQRQAAHSLGMTRLQTYIYILLPRAFLDARPSLVTQSIVLFQDTSLVYIIGINDLFTVANRQGQNTGNITVFILFAGFFYFSISYLSQRLFKGRPRRLEAKRSNV